MNGDYFKEIRNYLQLNQAEMAKLLGIAKATLSQLESIKKEDELKEQPNLSTIANTIIGIEKLVEEAKKNNPEAIKVINQMYEKLNSSIRWASGIGTVATNPAFGFIAAGIASIVTGAVIASNQKSKNKKKEEES